MHNQQPANHDDEIDDVKRFERMEDGHTEYYFDVRSIENIFDFYAGNDQFDKAERALQLGIKTHPDSLSLLIKQSIVLIEKEENEQAIALLNTIVKFEQSDPEIYFNLGYACIKNDNVPEAVSFFNKTLDVAGSEYEDFLLDIGISLNRMDECNLAIAFLEPGCKKYPDNEELLFELAFACEEVNDIAKGIVVYEQLLNINPFSEDGWYSMGVLYANSNNHEKAISCYDFVLALNPGHPDALFSKAKSLYSSGKFEKALNVYFEYTSYDYDTVLAYRYIAKCFEQMKQYRQALRFYRQAVKADPEYYFVWLEYLALLINTERVKEALSASMKALSIIKTFPELVFLRGMAQMLAGRNDRALKWFEHAIHMDPDNLQHLFEWLQLKQKMEPVKIISTHLKEWMEDYPDSSAVNYVAAGIALRETGNMNSVATCLETALSKMPEDLDYFIEIFEITDEEIQRNGIISRIIAPLKDYQF